MPTVKSKLQEIRALLSDPEKWTTSVPAVGPMVNGTRMSINPLSTTVEAWALSGARVKVCDFNPELLKPVQDALIAAYEACTGESKGYVAWMYHTNTTHPEVLAVIDRAIANA